MNRNETKRQDETNKKSSTAKEAKIKSMRQQTRQATNSAGTKIPNFISQGSDTASCSFLPRLPQSILRRRRRFGYSTAQHTSALTHHDQKRNVNSAGTKPQTASHKGQYLQAAVSFHGCCNRFCAVVADSVAFLHSTCQSRINRETLTLQ